MSDHDPGEPDDEESWHVVGTRTVGDGGRVNIPAEKLGLEENDVVNMIVGADDESFFCPDRPVESRGRVSIPVTQRRLYGVSVGDPVDVEVKPTGRRINGDGEGD